MTTPQANNIVVCFVVSNPLLEDEVCMIVTVVVLATNGKAQDVP